MIQKPMMEAKIIHIPPILDKETVGPDDPPQEAIW